MKRLRVLVACEESGTVRDAFIKEGHLAVSCDILPSASDNGPHIQCDVTALLGAKWDLIIAHPPCTYLCNSGVRWLYTQPGRFELMREAAEFFKKCWHAPCSAVAVENPIMHRHAMEIIKDRYSQVVQPWQYGHGETKATCLWLRGLPCLTPTQVVSGRYGRIHKLPPSEDRPRLRAVTYEGIARAMAQQWGAFLTGGSVTHSNQHMQPAIRESENAVVPYSGCA